MSSNAMPNAQPLVGIIMGSKSDWETMRAAAETLARFGVAHEAKVVSAHRTPAWMVEYASSAEARGLQVIIAGAGGAAHLPGMVAANTLLPVLGVPVESHALKGLDSLLSIVQMPGDSGGHAGDRESGRAERGAAGGGDPGESRSGAAREAARVSRGTGHKSPLGRVGVKPILGPGAAIGVLGSGQLGRMFAIAARRMGYRVHTLSPDQDTPTGKWRTWKYRRPTTIWTRSPISRGTSA
jgi:5-(carboxyamino)imidazole ribonucleotide mutase